MPPNSAANVTSAGTSAVPRTSRGLDDVVGHADHEHEAPREVDDRRHGMTGQEQADRHGNEHEKHADPRDERRDRGRGAEEHRLRHAGDPEADRREHTLDEAGHDTAEQRRAPDAAKLGEQRLGVGRAQRQRLAEPLRHALAMAQDVLHREHREQQPEQRACGGRRDDLRGMRGTRRALADQPAQIIRRHAERLGIATRASEHVAEASLRTDRGDQPDRQHRATRYE